MLACHPQYEHLDEEVKHVAPENVRVFDDKELLEMDAALDKYAKSHGDPFLLVPYMVSYVSSPTHFVSAETDPHTTGTRHLRRNPRGRLSHGFFARW